MDYEPEVDMDVEVVGSDEDVAIIGRDDVSNYNPDNILPEPPAVITKIRQWLEPTPYRHEGGEHRRHLASHAEGTGQWLTATENYKKWHAGSDHGLLWIKGIPGSGKSVFAATLADALAREGHPVLFFFFRQIIDANHEPVHLLRDWLDQILEYSPPLQRDLKVYIDDERSDLNRKLESLGIDDLWKHLKTALAHMPRVYLVADALDEMDKGNDEFLKALARLGLWKPREVKVLITSRPVNTVEAPLREFPVLRIRLEERLVDVDIATYVQHSLESSTISPEDRTLIKVAVPGRANGLFLYAKLAMDAFLEPNSDVRQVLKTLPTDLNAMYTDLLREHAQRSGVPSDIQRLLLCWVTHATRPLRLIEIAEMLSVTYNTAGRQHDLKSAKGLVRVACGPLLEIHLDETVSVVHHSLTEFLLGSTRSVADVTDESSQSFPILMPGPTHEQLALSCIRYLQSSRCLDRFSNVEKTEQDDSPYWRDSASPRKRHNALRLKFPFAEYACKNWPVHTAKSASAGLAASTALLSALDGFLAQGQRLDAWLDIEWRPSGTKDVTPCHIAARYGLTQYLQHLLSRGGAAVVNCVDSWGQTPLFSAAEKGHGAAVNVLIDAGAHPDPDNAVGLKPLHEAAANNHASVVTVLLAAGVDPLTPKTRENPGRRCGNAPITRGHTPLMYACQAGHVAAVEAFLPYLKDVDTVQRALYWATKAAKANVVKRLIQHPGVDVNAQVRGDTALLNACTQNDVESMEALLMAGADATALCRGVGDEFGGIGTRVIYLGGSDSDDGLISPLEAFCSSGNLRRFRSTNSELETDGLKHGLELLLRAGADIYRRDSNLRTPLHHAAGRPALLRLLLLAGADPNAESSDGSTLLHTQLHGEEGWDLVKLLAEEGKANINKRRHNDGKTPLLVFVDSWDLSVCLRFIEEFRPDCTIADNDGNTPLHKAASLSHRELRDEVIDALLAAGARIDQRNRKGEMPIHHAEELSVVELLVSRRADLEAQDSDGATPLMRRLRSSRYKKPNDMARLLGMGAKLDTRDFRGRTLVHEALSRMSGSEFSAREDLENFQHLIGLGLDPKQVDYAGNTALHELAQRSSTYGTDIRIPVFEDLVRRGVDPDAVNYTGQTVLHILSGMQLSQRLCEQALFDVALAVCKNRIDAPDHEGIRPIHVAAKVSTRAVLRLMDAGADISAPTYEGHTPLHLAAWARESNTVGVLLTAVNTTAKYRHASRGIIDAVDNAGCTPLYYACLSGRPETVALLLKAGAEVRPWSEKLLEACSGFEHEDGLCLRSSNMPDTPRSFSDLNYANFTYLSTRLDEILHMLVDHGLDLSARDWYGRSHLHAAMGKLHGSTLDYTVRCLLKLRAETADNEPKPPAPLPARAPPSALFPRRWAEIRREAATRAFHEIDIISLAKESHQQQESLILQLLARREFDLVEAACKPGGCDPCLPNHNGWTILHALVAIGHASLLARIATQDDVKRIDGVEWRREQENPGQGRSNDHPSPGSILPLVLAACKREVPNMDVLRILVEKMNAAVDAGHLEHKYQSETASFEYEAGDAPLHVLAKGERWWQVHEALPYLLLRKPDLEVRDHEGETPLHKALDNTQYKMGPFHKEAARLLVAAGADVNAVTNDGKTCLAVASNDVELTRLLIAYGAKVTVSAVFAAIDNQHVSILEALLSAGGDNIDSNMLREKPKKKKRSRPAGEFDFLSSPLLYMNQPEDEQHALYRAATQSLNSMQGDEEKNKARKRITDMVRVLLAHGADPFDTFRVWKPVASNNDETEGQEEENDEPSESEFERLTVIHQVLLENGIIGPFLELPTLDLEHHNSSGQTLLLAACGHYSTFCSTVESSSGQEENQPERPLLIDVLLQRGADTSARDNSGRNALHHAFCSALAASDHFSRQTLEAFEKPLRSLLTSNPSLIKHADNSGKTPLHYALASLRRGFMRQSQGESESESQSEGEGESKSQNTGEKIITLLLSTGADPTALDTSSGDSALHFLVRAFNHNPACPGLFRRFLGSGLDVNARNSKGETPVFGLLEGLRFGNEAIIARHWLGIWPTPEDDAWKVLGDAGADFKARDNRGRNLLHLAAEKEVWVAVYKRLVGMGLDPMELDEGQRNSLDVAAACGNEGVLGLFEKEGEENRKVAEEENEDL
ncbi:ankyrin-2 [Parachaetomium inaequale]|uniref:Ankyrin-2 n=1 Tax=Parachaetomium inaequale TaxID=2588326 RepID=A0AAN6SLQ4_9PEZI|nr:ankyrin-2 [Parachaetomium inaequale]